MSELNKQYFETRQTHKKSVKKNAWIIWVILIAVGLIWIYNEISNQTDKPLTQETITNKVENFAQLSNDSVILSKQKDFEIFVKGGLYFGYVSDELPIMIISNDSSDLILYVKKTTTDKKYDSLIKHWESKMIETDSTYRFSNIKMTYTENLRKEIGTVELTKNGKDFIGEILILENEMSVYIVQGIANRNNWQSKRADIEKMIDSFEIK